MGTLQRGEAGFAELPGFSYRVCEVGACLVEVGVGFVDFADDTLPVVGETVFGGSFEHVAEASLGRVDHGEGVLGLPRVGSALCQNFLEKVSFSR